MIDFKTKRFTSWNKIEAKKRFELSNNQYHEESKTQFSPYFIYSYYLDNFLYSDEFSFLRKILHAPKDFVYLYLLFNRKNNVVKVGQSKNPFERLLSHVYYFESYANLSSNNLGAFISRFPIPSNSNSENYLIQRCENKKTLLKKLGKKNEFFITNNLEDIIEFSRDTFRKLEFYLLSIN